MITIVGFAGSLRQGSYNAALLRAAGAMMPAGSELHAASIREIPLYNGDDEAARGVPPAVTALKDAIAAAGGVLPAAPQYNNSHPGVPENALALPSPPPAGNPLGFGGKAGA